MKVRYEQTTSLDGLVMNVPQLDSETEFDAWLTAEQDAAYAAGQRVECAEISEGVGYTGI